MVASQALIERATNLVMGSEMVGSVTMDVMSLDCGLPETMVIGLGSSPPIR